MHQGAHRATYSVLALGLMAEHGCRPHSRVTSHFASVETCVQIKSHSVVRGGLIMAI